MVMMSWWWCHGDDIMMMMSWWWYHDDDVINDDDGGHLDYALFNLLWFSTSLQFSALLISQELTLPVWMIPICNMMTNQQIHCTHSRTCILLHSNRFHYMFQKCHNVRLQDMVECECLNESNHIEVSMLPYLSFFFLLDSFIFKYFMILINNQNLLLCTGWYQVSLGNLPRITSFLSHCIKHFENLIFFIPFTQHPI